MQRLTTAGLALAVAVGTAVMAPTRSSADRAPPVTWSAPPAAGPSDAPAEARATPGLVCLEDELAARLVPLLRAERHADLHHAAVAATALCPGALATVRLLDAIALLRLEDRPAAYAQLVALDGTPRAELARLVLGWAYRTDGDVSASDAVLARVPAPRAAAIRALTVVGDREAFRRQLAGLPTAVGQRALALQARHADARGKSPALSGVLSALLPGAGQVYAGSLQAAAVSLVLNGLFIAATVELARDDRYFTAAAAGTAASFFYVGGIMNAVDLARRRNDQASAPIAAELEALLVPELTGQFK
jgi:hypothetical protein